MADPLLAQIIDVETRLGRPLVDPIERAQCRARLADASAVIRGYAKRTFTRTTTTEILRPVGATLKLPNRPVQAVTAINLIGFGQARIPLPTFYWDGFDEVWIYGGANDQIINLPESLTDIWMYRTPLCEVTYTHGFDPIPDDVVAVAAGMVVRTATIPNGGAVVSQAAGDFHYRLAPTALLGPNALTDAERDVLNSYRRGGRGVELRGG